MDKFAKDGPWNAVFEGKSVNINGQDYCGFVKQEGKFGEILALPVPDLCIAPGRKIRITVEVLE